MADSDSYDYSDDAYSDDFEESPSRAKTVPQASNTAAAPAAPAPAAVAADPEPEPEEKSVSADEGDVDEIKQLKQLNEDLRNQLLSLNGQLDDALNQRGEKIVQITRVQKTVNADVEKLQRDIDKLRRANGRLSERLRCSDAAGRASELQNQLAERQREVERLREDNRSLENVRRNQAKKLASVLEVEDRINAAKEQHLEDTRAVKERIAQLRALREADGRTVKQQQQQINILQLKIKAAGQIKADPKSIAEMEKKLKEKRQAVDALRVQVATLSKNNDGEKKALQQQMKGNSDELKGLQAEAARLRNLLNNHDPFHTVGSRS